MHLLRTTSVTSVGSELAKELAAWPTSCPGAWIFLKNGVPSDDGPVTSAFRSAFRFTTVVDGNPTRRRF
jgi:hypothetical protein